MRCQKTVLSLAVLFAASLAASTGRADTPPAKQLGEADVLKLVELQIDDQAVIDRLKAGGGVAFKVDDAVIDGLKKAGASERVLDALKGIDHVIAHAQHESGTIVEITEIKRTSDGFLQVSFRYRNPTEKAIKVYGWLATTGNVRAIYCIDPKDKEHYGLAKDASHSPVGYSAGAENAEMIAPANGFSPTYWLKMTIPSSGVNKVTFYFPNAVPMEDVPLPPVKK